MSLHMIISLSPGADLNNIWLQSDPTKRGPGLRVEGTAVLSPVLTGTASQYNQSVLACCYS